MFAPVLPRSKVPGLNSHRPADAVHRAAVVLGRGQQHAQVYLLRDRLQLEYQQVLAGTQLDGFLELPDPVARGGLLFHYLFAVEKRSQLAVRIVC